MGQNLRIESHCDAFHALREEERELDGQVDGLFLATVVGEHPLGGFGVEDRFEGELAEARLDVTWRGGPVAREDIAPVTLTVDEQVLLPELHQRVADTGIAVRVVLHSLPDDVRHLVVLAVVHPLHSVEDTALHGLQTVLDGRHGALQNHIGGIVQEPVLVHAREVLLDCVVKVCHTLFGLVVRRREEVFPPHTKRKALHSLLIKGCYHSVEQPVLRWNCIVCGG